MAEEAQGITPEDTTMPPSQKWQNELNGEDIEITRAMLAEMLVDVLKKVEAVQKEVGALKEIPMKVEKLEHVVYGNGAEGLGEAVRNLVKKMATMERLAWIIATVLAGILMTTLFNVFIDYVKRMP